VLRALEARPELRYQTVAEMRTQVEAVSGDAVPTETIRMDAGAVNGAPRPGWLARQMSPLANSPLANEIMVHLTAAEKREMRWLGGVFGIWNAATWFAPFFILFIFPAPFNHWLLALVAWLVGIVCYPFWYRMMWKIACSTQWARGKRLTLEILKADAKAHEKPAPMTAAAGLNGEGRFSRTALLGAAWVTLFFGVVPAFLWHEVQTHEFERHGPFASGLMAFVCFGFIFPAFIAPFGATILGWVAVTRIRHSAGRIYGLGLAMFDGLFFPLLALDALILAVNVIGRHHVIVPGLQPGMMLTKVSIPGWQMLLMLAFIVLVDWLIVREVWHMVKRPLAGSTKAVNQVPRASIAETRWGRAAFCAAMASGFCAAACWCLMPQPLQFFVWAILGFALVAVVLGLKSRHTAGGKFALVFGVLQTIVWVCVFFDMARLENMKNVQAGLGRNGALTTQMGEAIEDHLVEAGLKAQVKTFEFDADGALGRMRLFFLPGTHETDGQKIGRDGFFHFFDRGQGDWWVQGEGPLAKLSFAMQGAALTDGKERLARVMPEVPFPLRRLTRASDGGTVEFPDLLAVLPEVRALPAYRAWLETRGAQILFITTAADFRCEVHFMGQMSVTAGSWQDVISEIVLLRPDRTRLAAMVLPPPDRTREPYTTTVYDAAGTEAVMKAHWQPGVVVFQAVMDDLYLHPGKPDENVWRVDAGGVIQDTKKPLVWPLSLSADITSGRGMLAKHNPRRMVAFGPVMERVLPYDRGCINFQTGSVMGALDLATVKNADPMAFQRKWERLHGLDAMVNFQAKGIGKVVMSLRDFKGDDAPRSANMFENSCYFVREEGGTFDAARAPDVYARLHPEGAGAIYGELAHGDGVWWFQTLDGARGVLETSESPSGLKIRYKLIDPPSFGQNPSPLQPVE
jgi:hypothetical protein